VTVEIRDVTDGVRIWRLDAFEGALALPPWSGAG